MGLVTPDFGLLFWMLLSFSVVLFVLRKFAWKPILQTLKERENTIQNALDAAKKTQEEMAKLKADNEKILQEARTERDTIIKEARENKEKIIAEAKKQATFEANKLIESAKTAIESEKLIALKEIKDKVAELSVEIAEKLLRKELSKENKQNELLNVLINEVKMN